MTLLKPFLLFLAVTIVSLYCSAAPPGKIGDFALLDQVGKHHMLSWYGDQKAIVIFIQGNGDPAVRNGAVELKKVREEFKEQNVVFFMLNPRTQDNRASIVIEAEEFGYDFPILVDESQLVAETLGVDRTAETFVIDPKKLTVVFRGPINDQLSNDAVVKNHYLKDALNRILSGQAIAANIPSKSGSVIEFPGRELHQQNPISYTDDIVPILQDNCVSCHHQGGIGPWAMSSHTMVLGWSMIMREMIMTRRMPPGLIDPHVGKPIEDVAEITPEEKQLLVHWIDALMGQPQNMPNFVY